MDLTVRKLLSADRIGETTERSGDFCGGTYVDYEFIKYIKSRVGESAMDLIDDRRSRFHYLSSLSITKTKWH